MSKMTKTSKENLKIADRIIINKQKIFDCYIDDCYLVEAWFNGNISFVSDVNGPLIFKSITEAQKTISTVRPDISKFPAKISYK